MRRQMRFDTNALRIRYGVPIFVTFTPDESHNRIMLRLSRARNKDPVFIDGRDEIGALTAGRTEPTLLGDAGDLFFDVPVADAVSSVPAYDERRKIIARDSLASVDGFRMMVSLAYEFLFGLRFCPFCPDCNNGKNSVPCQDLFGSSSTAEGGIFGRLDAVFTSIEAQKSKGSLHAHSQLFLQ